MTKRYDEPIEVVADPIEAGAPVGFRWRGRTYEIDLRLDSWRQTGEWSSSGARSDREYHRVLARPAGAMATGDLDPDGFMPHIGAVYDVYRGANNDWKLARIWD